MKYHCRWVVTDFKILLLQMRGVIVNRGEIYHRMSNWPTSPLYKRKRTSILFPCIKKKKHRNSELKKTFTSLGWRTFFETDESLESSPRKKKQCIKSCKYIHRVLSAPLKSIPKAFEVLKLQVKNFCSRDGIWPLLQSGVLSKPTEKHFLPHVTAFLKSRRSSPSN